MSDNSVKLIDDIEFSVQALIASNKKLKAERDDAINDRQALQLRIDRAEAELKDLNETVSSLKKGNLRINHIEIKKKEITEKIKNILIKLEKLDRTIFTDDAKESSL